MASLLPVLMVVLIIAVVAMNGGNGLWSNLILLFNVIISAMLATNFFEPIADWLQGMMPSLEIILDYVSLWMVFAIALFILQSMTGLVSKVKVKFVPQLDKAGGFVLAMLVGWILVCFTMTTLHTAPLSRNFLFKGFRPEEKMFFGFAPDRKWLGFIQSASLGAFARIPPEGAPEAYVFDPKGEFMAKYATRRGRYELTESITGKDTP